MKNTGIILLLILLPAFFYLEFVSSHTIIMQKDWLVRTYPLREEIVKMFKNKTLPLWSPYMLCGNQLLANIDNASAYPLYLFDFFMPVDKAVKWNFLSHISLGGIFMYLFLKVLGATSFGAITSAITFMFGGYMQSFMPHPFLWIPAVYLPLIFLLFELSLRKEKKVYMSLGGIVLALQILSGLPQIVYYTLLALFLYTIYYFLVRDPSARFTPILYFMGLVFLGFSLSAFQLIPTYECYLQSAKYHLQTTGDASQLMPMLPHAILFFIGVADPYTSGFIGIGGLLLAFLGSIFWRNKLKFFFAGLCVLVLLSVFEITHFYKIIFRLPGFSMFNSLHRFVSIYAFGISVLAGFGASAFSRVMNSDNRRFQKRIPLILFIITCILILAFSLNYFLKGYIIDAGRKSIEKNVLTKPGHPFSMDYYSEKLENLHRASLQILGLAILPLTGIFIITLLRKNSRISNFTFRAALIGLIILELYGHWRRLGWKFVDPAEYYRPSEAVSFIKKDTSIYRAFGLDNDDRYHFDYENSRKINDLLIPDLATFHQVQDPQGMNTFNLWNYWQVMNLINKDKSPLEKVFSRDRFHLLAITNPYHNLLDLFNIKYLLSYSPIIENDRWKLIFDRGVKVYQNRKVMPRAFMAYNYKTVQNEETVLQMLNSPDFDAGNTVILDSGIDKSIGPPSANKVEITKYSPLEIKIDAYTERPGVLVLSDLFYPGWRAKVDGRQVKILRAYSIFRAIPLPEGSHRITFSYLPLSFIGGCFISIITIIIIILAGLRRLFRF